MRGPGLAEWGFGEPGVAFVTDAPSPYVPVMEAAGVVDRIGEGTDTDLRVADRVMAIAVISGTYGPTPSTWWCRPSRSSAPRTGSTTRGNHLADERPDDPNGTGLLEVAGGLDDRGGRSSRGGRRVQGAAGQGGRPACERRRGTQARTAGQEAGRGRDPGPGRRLPPPGPRRGSRRCRRSCRHRGPGREQRPCRARWWARGHSGRGLSEDC